MMVFFVKIAVNTGAVTVLFSFIWLLLSSSFSYGLESDINCLKSLKASVEDPFNYLSSWDFRNTTEGFVCKLIGVDCWHPDENKVLNIRLSDMGLKGEFPRGLQNCSTLTGLDLSSNKFYGTIPSDISLMLQYVTTLDLASNNFSGEIPKGMANCTYLNVLKLDSNKLNGQIPVELSLLSRLKSFSAANNYLSGQVPNFNSSISVNYASNAGLCGGDPLPACQTTSKKRHPLVILGASVGGVIIATLVVGIAMFFFMRRVSRKEEEDPDANKWAKSIKGAKTIKLSMFEKSVSKMRLSDLLKATNSFNKDRIIGNGKTGTTYKATFGDGTSLMVKRLQDTEHSEKEFASEMATLGNVKHRNLVPLLGFCVTKTERFLVYKFMPNGTLHDRLQLVNAGDRSLDWPLRLKIGIGTAKGFAWLHHTCNPRIIHRNISSKCILLDADYEPKISDFGLARLMNPVDTHLSTFINGEFGDMGYVTPEYAQTLVATPKGDVYSFGVVLLELVTGEKPTFVAKAPESFKGNLVEWITQLSSNSKLQDSIDTTLTGKGYDGELLQFLKVACSCVLPAPKERPTMFEVYQLIRAMGERYHFSMDDDILMPSNTCDTHYLEELIVAREERIVKPHS